jgi:type I restriction enzyme S subunit
MNQYLLPEGWRWARLGEIIQEALPGFACGKRSGEEGTIQLRMNNITTKGKIDLSSVLKVPASKAQIEKYRLLPGDVIFNNTNSAELVGKTALFDLEKDIFVYSNHLTRLRPLQGVLDSTYLALWLQLQWCNRVFELICNRWIGQAALQRDKLLGLEIPLPPIPEQRRIAAKIRELMQDVGRAHAACEKQLGIIDLLPQKILEKAFRGKL